MDSFVEQVKRRFSSDRHYRKWMHCTSSDPDSAEYQRGLELACRVEAKNIADAAKSRGKLREEMEQEPSGGNAVSRVLKNRRILNFVG